MFRTLSFLVAAAAFALVPAADSKAMGRRSNCCGYGGYNYVSPPPVTTTPPAPPIDDGYVSYGNPCDDAMRQCRGVYFNAYFSAWFESDVMVPACCAEVGVSIPARVPGTGGRVIVWVTQVYDKPKLTAPQ
jgi:hypothetical protein